MGNKCYHNHSQVWKLSLRGIKRLAKGMKLVRGRLWFYCKDLSNPPLSVLSYHTTPLISIIDNFIVYVFIVFVSVSPTRL